MEYDICERFCLMAQTALFNEHLPNVSSSDRHLKTSDSLLLVAAFSATGTIHLQLLQDNSILFQLPSQSHDSQNYLQTLKLCGLVGRFIKCHTGH